MSEWGYGLVVLGLLLAGALLWTLARAYFVVGVYAEYPQGVSFTGHGQIGRMTYYGLAWIRDDREPRPCPLVIHLADGDMAAADLAAPERLLARGWTRFTDDQELARGLPLVLGYQEGDYGVHLSYAGGTLTCVTVGVESAAAVRPDARGIAVSLRGGRVSLPVPEAELVRVLGAPTRRTRLGD